MSKIHLPLHWMSKIQSIFTAPSHMAFTRENSPYSKTSRNLKIYEAKGKIKIDEHVTLFSLLSRQVTVKGVLANDSQISKI